MPCIGICLRGRKNPLKLYAKLIEIKYKPPLIELYLFNKEKIFEMEEKDVLSMTISPDMK